MMKHEYSSFDISSAKVFYFGSDWYLEGYLLLGIQCSKLFGNNAKRSFLPHKVLQE
jgi:hypothetical protein